MQPTSLRNFTFLENNYNGISRAAYLVLNQSGAMNSSPLSDWSLFGGAFIPSYLGQLGQG